MCSFRKKSILLAFSSLATMWRMCVYCSGRMRELIVVKNSLYGLQGASFPLNRLSVISVMGYFSPVQSCCLASPPHSIMVVLWSSISQRNFMVKILILSGIPRLFFKDGITVVLVRVRLRQINSISQFQPFLGGTLCGWSSTLNVIDTLHRLSNSETAKQQSKCSIAFTQRLF